MTQQSAEGWFRKYTIRRIDGADLPGQKHDGCTLFVLDLTHDPCARIAALDYARQIERTKPNLAADIRYRVNLALETAVE